MNDNLDPDNIDITSPDELDYMEGASEPELKVAGACAVPISASTEIPF